MFLAKSSFTGQIQANGYVNPDIPNKIYKALVLLRDGNDQELGMGVSTNCFTVRVHKNILKNCYNPSITFLHNNKTVSTIFAHAHGSIAILSVSSSK